MDEDEDGAYGPINDDESGTGYESASDASMTNRRKIETSSDDEHKLQKKKMKKDKHTQKNKYDVEFDLTETNDDNNQTKERDSKKIENAKTKGSKKKDTNGFLDDGWVQNKVYKTFIMEPTDDKHKLHIMEIAKLLMNIKITNYKELKPAGNSRYKITFDNPRHAENLINSKILTHTNTRSICPRCTRKPLV